MLHSLSFSIIVTTDVQKCNPFIKSITNMIMGNNKGDTSYSENTISSSTSANDSLIVDAKTLVGSNTRQNVEGIRGPISI